MKWYPFNQEYGGKQRLPKERKDVLVELHTGNLGSPNGYAVGYLRFAAGDKNSPQFIVPGIRHDIILAWCDCLPCKIMEIEK